MQFHNNHSSIQAKVANLIVTTIDSPNKTIPKRELASQQKCFRQMLWKIALTKFLAASYKKHSQ